MSSLKTKNIFSTKGLDLHPKIVDLLHRSEYPWQVLPLIKQTIKQMVESIDKEDRIKGKIDDSAIIKSDLVVIEEGATVEGLAYIDGPTYIASGATVRHGAYIRGGVYIGPNSLAGHTTEIKDSLLLNTAKAAHFAYLGNSILGNQVNLGAGTKLANLRLDKKAIILRHEGKSIETNLKKFGAIFGDFCQTGCNSVTNPGTVFLPYSAVFPTKNIGGIVENKMLKEK